MRETAFSEDMGMGTTQERPVSEKLMRGMGLQAGVECRFLEKR
jgi:hypothetical protein